MTKEELRTMRPSQRDSRLANLIGANLVAVLRTGQSWRITSPSLDHPSKEWDGQRPPRRLTVKGVDLPSYAVFVSEWPKPLDPELFVRGFYTLATDNEAAEPQIAYRRLPALSIQQPWAWAIMRGYKPIENRTWKPPINLVGKPFWVHASKVVDGGGLEQLKKLGVPGVPKQKDYITGAILGAVRLAKVLDSHPSIYFSGPWGWLLESPLGLPEPIPMKGKLQFWMPEFYRR